AKLKEEEKPSSSTPKDKIDSMMKTMEKLMDRLALGNNSAPPVHKNLNLEILNLGDLKTNKYQEKLGINSLIL
ncbi:hypothetical protein, partial [Actinobacillus pleuropneumoniae]